jgi:hypothetical protein
VQSCDNGLIVNIFCSTGDYALHIDVGNTFNIVVFVRDRVVVRGIVILLNFALEGTVCREEFADLLADSAQTFFLVCGISVPQNLGRRL